MGIVGIGSDIVEVARIRKLLQDKREEFLKRVFTREEIEYCESRARPEIHFAARFAAKEALMKAIGTGWSQGVGFGQIRIHNNDEGRPDLTVSDVAAEMVKALGGRRLWVTLSHTKEVAMATVIIEG